MNCIETTLGKLPSVAWCHCQKVVKLSLKLLLKLSLGVLPRENFMKLSITVLYAVTRRRQPDGKTNPVLRL